jgi:DNA-directed RNA polymerase subunit RPC12/RpoP
MYIADCPRCKQSVVTNVLGPEIPGTEYEAKCPHCGEFFFGTLVAAIYEEDDQKKGE